jgi:Fuc2NAc and GlcNAc transferase
MEPSHLLLPVVSFLLAWSGTAAMRRYALRSDLLDVPNERSSHTIPTPRGGGVAVVVTVCAVTVACGMLRTVDSVIPLVVLVGGGGVALVGYLDDRYDISTLLRLAVHFGASILAVVLIDGAILFPEPDAVLLRAALSVAAIVGVTWMVNLFNFMDGIDGIAASQAAFMSGAAAILNVVTDGPAGLSVLLASIMAASCGFLVLNWPPASIFMGDVGSGFVGFTLGSLSLVCNAETKVSIWAWVTLGALFIGDSTATLLRRALNGERWYAAHRSHAYQILARRFGRHQPVTLLFLAINVLLVLPAASIVVAMPRNGPLIAVLSVLLAGAASLILGAGRSDTSSERL